MIEKVRRRKVVRGQTVPQRIKQVMSLEAFNVT
jgi:ribosomal protein S6E (S10)